MKIIKSVVCVSTLAVVITCTGCASIVNGSHEKIRLSTAPVKGAHCVLTNNKGVWHVKSTPAVVKVHRDSEPLSITCQKKHYITAKTKVNARFDGTELGNIVAGGVIGVAVDSSTKASYQYPPLIKLKMRHK